MGSLAQAQKRIYKFCKKTYRRKPLRIHRSNWEDNISLQFTSEKQRVKVADWIHTKAENFMTNRIIIYSQKILHHVVD